MRNLPSDPIRPLPEIPPRSSGKHHDTVSMCCLDHPAGEQYQLLRRRLFSIAAWHELNDSIRTDFQLCDAAGQAIDRDPQTGDHIRIDLPGPGSPSGDGYDWVRLVAIAEETGEAPWACLTISPCANPLGDNDNTAHFYTAEATNTFVVRQLGNCLQAEVHGRNEEANVSQGPMLDRVRNEAVALAGKIGMGKIQWKDWTDGMISVIRPREQ